MKKINIVKKSMDFTRIIKTKVPCKNRLFVIYKEDSDDVYKFGITVSKKIGNAVTRNRIKRQIKSIIDKKHYKNNFNCIIIIRKDILNKSYEEISNELYYLFRKMGIFKEEL